MVINYLISDLLIIKMNKNIFNNNVASLKKAINNDRLVIFAGSGVSKDSGIPIWKELIEGIKNHLNELTEENDPLKIAQMLYNEKGEKEYNDIIRDILFKHLNNYNSLHEILFELNPQHIITTNYDSFFESVINDNGLPFSIVSKDQDLPYAKHKKLLIKYHGDFENQNLVLKENDYLEFSKNHTLKEVFVKSLFSNKVILFVGYSVSDPNLKLLIKEVQHLLKKHYQRAYLLSAKEKISNSEIRYFENLGINILAQNIDDKTTSKVYNTTLSDVGLNVFNKLRYIKDFKLYEYTNLLSDESSREKIINELYNSLNRFHYMRVLPHKILASLYPLSKDSKLEPTYLSEGTILKCFNDSLLDIIKDYKGNHDENFSEEEKIKLNYSLSRIAMSGIYYFGKLGMVDSWGGYPVKEEIDIISKINHKNTCNCIDCTLNSYNYSKALKKIYKYDISNKTELWDDLIYAHGLYRIHDFYNCFLAYNKIILKANQLKKHEVSFLLKYNLKRLKWAINNDFYNSKIDWEDIQEIKSEIDKINLDQELDKVKYFVDKDVYSFLKEIRDGAYIQLLCNEIDEIYVDVPRTVENIKKGGSNSSNVFNNLYLTVRKLKDFLDLNFILGNGFSQVNKALEKSINTFILGYCLKNFINIKRHKFFGIPHIEEFNASIFDLIVDYSNTKELIKILEDNNIDNIKIEEKSQKTIYKYINNFFKSSFSTSTIFRDEPRQNDYFVSVSLQNESFNNFLKLQFNAICIVIAYFNFSQEQLNQIYSNLIFYINFMEFKETDFEYLTVLLNKKHDVIEKEDLIKTLNVLDKKNIINRTYFTLLKYLKLIDSKFTHESDNLRKIDLNKHRFDFPILFKVLKSNDKKNLRKTLEGILNEARDGQIYFIAISHRIISTNKIKSNYKKIINEQLQINFKDSNVNDDHIKFRVKQFFDLVYRGLIDLDGIQIHKIQEEVFKFLVSPEEFNQEKFDPNWLKFYNWDSYCKRFSKIDYIIISLEKFLVSDYDEKIGEVYFSIKKNI